MRIQRIPVSCSAKRVMVALGGLVLCVASGCSSAGGTPRVDSATPRHVASGQSSFLIVEGAGFNRGASAMAGSSALNRVTWVNGHVLTAELPAGLPPGSYDLSVSNPGGGRTTLAQALVVEGGQPPAQAQPAVPPSVAATKLPAPAETRTVPSPTSASTAKPTATPAPPSATPEQTRTAEPVRTATSPAAATATRQATIPSTQPPAPRPTNPPAAPRQGATPNITGQWTIVDTISYGPGVGGQYPFAVAIQQTGTQVAGSGGGLRFVGTISGNTVHVDYQQDNGATGSFDWAVSADGNTLSGSFTNSSGNGGDSTGVRGGSGAIVLFQPALRPAPAAHGKQKPKDR